MVHNAIAPTQTKCVTCGVSLHPTMILKYLHKTTSFEGTITENDQVCYPCYKSHLYMSIDEGLQDLLTTISNQSNTSIIGKIAMDKVTVAVGKEILAGRALLLKTAHIAMPAN